MTDQAKLEMAVKYCSDEYADKLTTVIYFHINILIKFYYYFLFSKTFFSKQAIEYWEKITDMIVRREKIVYQLENFERNASDPNRFFVKSKP